MKKIISDNKYWPIIMLAVPASIEMVFQQVLGLIDNVFISHISDEKLAAVGLCNQIYSLILIIVAAIASGVGILIAQNYGKQDFETIKKIIHDVLKVAVLGAIGLIVIFKVSIRNIVLFMGAEDLVIQYVEQYWNIVIFSLMCSVINSILGSILRAMNNTKTPLVANGVGLLTNTCLNYFLIFVAGMDIKGAAIATILSRLLILVLFVIHYRRIGLLSLQNMLMSTDRKLLQNIAMISIPIFIGELAWAIGSFMYNSFYTRIGTFAIVAYQIVFSVEEIFIMFSFGFTVVGFSLVAQHLGKNEVDEAVQKSNLILNAGKISAIIFGILLVIFTWTGVPMMYSDTSATTVAVAKIALSINAGIQIIKIINFILGNGVLKSGGKTKNVMLVDTIATFLGLLFAFILAFYVKMGFWGVFAGKVIEELIRYCLMTALFKSRKWIQSMEEAYT